MSTSEAVEGTVPLRETWEASRAYTNRYEIKYIVPVARLAEIEAALAGFLEADPLAPNAQGYYVHSVYFDSPDYRLYGEKIEGELARIKPRIRSYRATLDTPPRQFFLELKGRYDRIVAKRRVAIDHALAEELTEVASAQPSNGLAESSVWGEFAYLAARFRLAPSVAVMYHRVPYFGAFYPDVRVTFDRVIQCSLTTAPGAPGGEFAYALPPNLAIIELKYNDKVPRFLLGRLHSLGLRQATVSKYAISVEACFAGIDARRRHA